jgi:hypothetical protein
MTGEITDSQLVLFVTALTACILTAYGTQIPQQRDGDIDVRAGGAFIVSTDLRVRDEVFEDEEGEEDAGSNLREADLVPLRRRSDEPTQERGYHSFLGETQNSHNERDTAGDQHGKTDATGSSAAPNCVNDAKEHRHEEKAVELKERAEDATWLHRNNSKNEDENQTGNQATHCGALQVLVGDEVSQKRPFRGQSLANVSGCEQTADAAEIHLDGHHGDLKV